MQYFSDSSSTFAIKTACKKRIAKKELQDLEEEIEQVQEKKANAMQLAIENDKKRKASLPKPSKAKKKKKIQPKRKSEPVKKGSLFSFGFKKASKS